MTSSSIFASSLLAALWWWFQLGCAQVSMLLDTHCLPIKLNILSTMRFTAFSLCLFASSVAAFSPVATPNARLSSALNMAEGGEYDFDVAIIGCGVGGHGAALHSRAQDLKTAVFAGEDIGGTCVNRGCVPSKALLAASGRVREMKDEAHLASLGINVAGDVEFDRQGIADHAKNLASNVKRGLEGSLVGLGCDIIEGRGILTGNPHEIKDAKTGKVYTAKVRYMTSQKFSYGCTRGLLCSLLSGVKPNLVRKPLSPFPLLLSSIGER